MDVGMTLMCYWTKQISHTPEFAAAPFEYEKPCRSPPPTPDTGLY